MANPPTWDTVKRLFSGADIGFMKMYGFDFDDYDFVAQNLSAILSRIEDGSMPPKPEFAPWSEESVQMLKDWEAGGFLRSETLDSAQTKFIQMSEFLTGFDDLHQDPGLAIWYLDRLNTRPQADGGVNPDAFKKLMDGFDSADTATFESQILTQGDCEAAAKTVITLWYTAAFPGGANATGTPDDNRYISGLMWRAFHAHPMGYSSEGWYDHAAQKYSLEGEPYWMFIPQANGQFTGLGPNSVEP